MGIRSALLSHLLETVKHHLPGCCGVFSFLGAAAVVLSQPYGCAAICLLQLVADPVIILRPILLAGERAEVGDFQSPTGLDSNDFAFVHVLAALKLALPRNGAAGLPIGSYLRAEHVLLDELGVGECSPDLFGWGLDFTLSSRNMS